MNQSYLFQRALEIAAERQAEALAWRQAHDGSRGPVTDRLTAARPTGLTRRAVARIAVRFSRGAARLARTLDPWVGYELSEFEQ